MTSNRFGSRSAPLRYDPSRAFVPFTTISRTEVIAIYDRLETARRELHSDLIRGLEGRRRGDLAFVDLPERMLADYERSRRESELGRILALGKRLRDTVDRVVLLAPKAGLLAIRALFAAGCHPHHNELSRGDRGGRPRIYLADGNRGDGDFEDRVFVSSVFDNDAIQGLLDLLCHTRRAATVEECWAVIAVDDCAADEETPPETPAALECLLAALGRSCGGDRETAADRFVAVAIAESPVAQLAAAKGCRDAFTLPAGLPLSLAPLTAGGLLPATVMGLDVVALLRGAAAMNERFRAAPPGENPALDFAAVSHVARSPAGGLGKRIVPAVSALEAAARWCDELQTQRETRDTGRAQHGGMPTFLAVDAVRRDRLTASTARRPRKSETLASGSVVRLPTLDEGSLGQLLQMMLLAAEIEHRLLL